MTSNTEKKTYISMIKNSFISTFSRIRLGVSRLSNVFKTTYKNPQHDTFVTHYKLANIKKLTEINEFITIISMIVKKQEMSFSQDLRERFNEIIVNHICYLQNNPQTDALTPLLKDLQTKIQNVEVKFNKPSKEEEQQVTRTKVKKELLLTLQENNNSLKDQVAALNKKLEEEFLRQDIVKKEILNDKQKNVELKEVVAKAQITQKELRERITILDKELSSLKLDQGKAASYDTLLNKHISLEERSKVIQKECDNVKQDLLLKTKESTNLSAQNEQLNKILEDLTVEKTLKQLTIIDLQEKLNTEAFKQKDTTVDLTKGIIPDDNILSILHNEQKYALNMASSAITKLYTFADLEIFMLQGLVNLQRETMEVKDIVVNTHKELTAVENSLCDLQLLNSNEKAADYQKLVQEISTLKIKLTKNQEIYKNNQQLIKENSRSL